MPSSKNELNKIIKSKENVKTDEYFNFFDKNIPTNLVNKDIYLRDISNTDVLYNIIEKNPSNNYFINDVIDIFNVLKIRCRKDFPETNLIFYNPEELDMKFDLIIMNPPYDGQLHLKIFEEAIRYLTPDGTCVNISPTTWLAKSNINRPMAKFRKTFNGKIKDIEIIDHNTANIMFGTGNAIEELGIYTVKNNNSKSIDLMNYGFNNAAEKSLYDKIDMMNSKIGVITYNKCKYNDKYGMVSSKDSKAIRKPFDVPIYTWHGGKTCKDAVLMLDTKKKVSMVLYFNSQVEHDNFINSLDTVFMNWYYYTFVVPGDCKIVNYMFRMSDYSQPWTDERFYKFFNITPEEQKIIEETMAKYSAS